MQMLLVRLVLVLLLITVLIGQTKPIVKSGMLTDDVLGVDEIVLLLTEINIPVNQILDVLGELLIVLVFEHTINHLASHMVDVLGAIIEEIALDLTR